MNVNMSIDSVMDVLAIVAGSLATGMLIGLGVAFGLRLARWYAGDKP